MANVAPHGENCLKCNWIVGPHSDGTRNKSRSRAKSNVILQKVVAEVKRKNSDVENRRWSSDFPKEKK